MMKSENVKEILCCFGVDGSFCLVRGDGDVMMGNRLRSGDDEGFLAT